MNMLWPGFLILLALIPLLAGGYIWMLRRRKRFAVRFSSLALVHAAQPHRSRLRRHLPFGLFLLALTSLVFALGRPVAEVLLPEGQSAIILALDVSRSMCQTDISPNRFEAAKSAAISFIEQQDPATQIGIVAFAGFAELVAAPTNDRDQLRLAVQSLATGRRTAIGSGILKSLDAIAELFEDVAPSGSEFTPGMQTGPLSEGEFAPYIVVLLTDGASNSGPHPMEAAQQAADRGVRVYTIGFGTANVNGGIPFCGPGYRQGGTPFGAQQFGGGGGGGGFNRAIDEETLKQVAAVTGGEYYSAESADQLNQVFQSLPTYAIIEVEYMEVSVFFTAIGALLAALAILLAMIWNPLP